MEVVELLLNLEFNTRLEVILICVLSSNLNDHVMDKIQLDFCDLQYLPASVGNK